MEVDEHVLDQDFTNIQYSKYWWTRFTHIRMLSKTESLGFAYSMEVWIHEYEGRDLRPKLGRAEAELYFLLIYIGRT